MAAELTLPIRPVADTRTNLRRMLIAYAIILSVALVICLVVAILIGLPDALGINVPSVDLQFDYISAVGFSLLVALGLLFVPVDEDERFALLILWLAKCFVGLIAMLWYEQQYFFLDAYFYFYEGQYFFSTMQTVEFGDGTTATSLISGFLLSMVPGEYHALKQSFSLIGLFAIFVMYRAITEYTGNKNAGWLLGLGLFPSILFWSSIIGKEPLAMLGISIWFLGVAKALRSMPLVGALYLAVGLLIMAAIRPWLAAIVMPTLFLALVLAPLRPDIRLLALLASIAVAISTLVFASDQLNFEGRNEALERLDGISRSWGSDGGSGQDINADLRNPIEYLAFLPVGVFSTLFRPLPGEVPNVLGLISGIENALLLFLFVLSLARSKWAKLRDPAILIAIVFLVCWLIPYAPVAYQNLGTGVRFKIQILPVFVALMFYLSKRNVKP